MITSNQHAYIARVSEYTEAETLESGSNTKTVGNDVLDALTVSDASVLLKVGSSAGDSRNAWAGQLTTNDGSVVGHEFAAPGINAPGYDQVNQLLDVASVDDLYHTLIDDILYADFTSKGFLDLAITRTEAVGTFHYVDTVFSEDYSSFSSDPITVSLAGQMSL